eukprot:5445290-Prymnesium_polylepis.1
MASLRERREVAMAMLNRLATRDATKQVSPTGRRPGCRSSARKGTQAVVCLRNRTRMAVCVPPLLSLGPRDAAGARA